MPRVWRCAARRTARTAAGMGAVRRRRDISRVEPIPDAGQGQVGGERRARVEDRFAVLVAIAGHRDGVAAQVTGGQHAGADQKPGGLQPVEELGLGGGAGHRAADGLAQLLPHGALPALALGLVAFGAGGPLGGGAVTRGDAVQAVLGFDEAGLGLGALAGAVVVGAAAVLPDEGGDDVDVVGGVADGGPAAAGAVAGVDAGGGDHAAGDLGPLLVGQDRVVGGGAHGTVPDVLVGTLVRSEEGQGLVEEMLEVLLRRREVAAGVGGHGVEGGDQVRVDVLLVGAPAVQVVQEAEGVAALLVDPGIKPPRPPAGW